MDRQQDISRAWGIILGGLSTVLWFLKHITVSASSILLVVLTKFNFFNFPSTFGLCWYGWKRSYFPPVPAWTMWQKCDILHNTNWSCQQHKECFWSGRYVSNVYNPTKKLTLAWSTPFYLSNNCDFKTQHQLLPASWNYFDNDNAIFSN